MYLSIYIMHLSALTPIIFHCPLCLPRRSFSPVWVFAQISLSKKITRSCESHHKQEISLIFLIRKIFYFQSVSFMISQNLRWFFLKKKSLLLLVPGILHILLLYKMGPSWVISVMSGILVFLSTVGVLKVHTLPMASPFCLCLGEARVEKYCIVIFWEKNFPGNYDCLYIKSLVWLGLIYPIVMLFSSDIAWNKDHN